MKRNLSRTLLFGYTGTTLALLCMGFVLMPPPTFIDTAPANVTVGCVSDVPPPVSLRAVTDMGDTILVAPVSTSMPTTITACSGGTITRTWIASDSSGMSAPLVQVITVLPDTTAIVVPIPPRRDTVSCELSGSGAPNNALKYTVWLSSTELALTTNLFAAPNCAGIDNITNNAPATYENDCGTVTVAYTIRDDCGRTSLWEASLTVIDTLAPLMTPVLPPDTLRVNCTDTLPAAPVVTATDNCAGSVPVMFSESSTQIMNGSAGQYEYFVTRIWTATDNCGNTTAMTQVIAVEDNQAPLFNAPPDTLLACTENPLDLNVTGYVSALMDDCSPTDSIEVTFTDAITPGSCIYNYTINRTWRARDITNNLRIRGQQIIVRDTVRPTFTVPADTIIRDCSVSSDPSVTGMPTGVSDNCDPQPTVSFSDVVSTPNPNCPNELLIRRTWRVQDLCGNTRTQDQIVRVIDDEAPTFSTAPQNLTLFCTEGLDIEAAFEAWAVGRAGASATDNCSDAQDLTWVAYNTGTTDPPSLAAPICPAADSVIRLQSIDIVVQDECMNQVLQTVTFRVVDVTPPVMGTCPPNQTIPTDAGLCSADFLLELPVIEDECALDVAMENLSATAPITSAALPGQESDIPVDAIVLQFPVSQPLPINAAGDATLSIDLIRADAEDVNEFFNILGEDGSLLGTTNLTPIQCGNSTTTLTLSATQINAWAADGSISIRLEPNIPAGLPGIFAINAICVPAGSVAGTLDFPVKQLGALRFEYRIDQDAPVTVAPIAAANVTLSQGEHSITYIATDCAGHRDSCAYTVTVVDNEPPVLSCPANMVVSVAADSCSKVVTLPLPAGVSDNCRALEDYQQTMPADTNSAYLTFAFNPNLSSYLAEQKIFTFTDVSANALSPVVLTFDFLGDFASNGAFFRVLAEDDTVLGVSAPGAATCSAPGQLQVTIPAATFNAWAADGAVTFRAVPNPIPVPPGVPGDGINPCDPSAVTATGQNDGQSYLFATLSYGSIRTSYFATGATNIPLTAMPAPAFMPSHEFALGETTLSYLVSDIAGNVDTCTFKVTVEDNIPPTVTCLPATTIFINPSGLQVEVINAAQIALASADNCTITNMALTPNTFNCSNVGSQINMTLAVQDQSGNTTTCNSLVTIAPEGPQPTANSGLCGGDTLYLAANAPTNTPGVIYQFRWFNPQNQLISTAANFSIPNITPANEGPYRVVIRGLTGCEAEGVVFVSIISLPLTPALLAQTSICREDALTLQSSVIPTGSGVTYRWYRGLPSGAGGTLLATTTMPSHVVAGPHTLGSTNYYMTVEANGCLSPPSAPVAVTAVQRPLAMVSYADTLVCEGLSINLGTQVTGVSYQWTGPNNFQSAMQFPTIGPSANVSQGYYRLRTSVGQCFSFPDSVLVSVKPKPETPVLLDNGSLCSGQTLALTTTSSGASSYAWRRNGNQIATTTLPSYLVPNAQPSSSGQWSLIITRNGCVSDVSAPTTVNISPTPVAMASASATAICAGGTLQLQGSPAGANYEWTGPGISPQVMQNPVISNIAQNNAGTYTLRVTTAAGCTDTASVAISVLPSVQINGVSNNAPACLNGPTNVQLTAAVFPLNTGTYTYQWLGPNGFMSASAVATIPNATAAANAGNYTLRVTNAQGCSSQLFTHTLNVADVPTRPNIPTTVSGATAFCDGSSFTLNTNQYSGSSVSYYWHLPNGNVLPPSSSSSLTINNAGPADQGAYAVEVLVDGCLSALSLPQAITINSIPQAAAVNNGPLCKGENIQFSTNFLQSATYQWFGPNGFNSSLQAPLFSSNNQQADTATYFVITTLNGCSSDTSFTTVVVKPRPVQPLASVASSNVCASIEGAVLVFSVNAGTATTGATYAWYDQAAAAQPIGVPTNQLSFTLGDLTAYPNDGMYSFFVQAELNGCRSTLSPPVQVTINHTPEVNAFAGDDIIVCNNQSANLQAEVPGVGTGRWTQTGGPQTGVQVVNPSQSSTTASGLTIMGSPYTFRWTLSNGACFNYDFDEVLVTVSQGEQALAGDNILACIGEVINLEAIAPTGVGSSGIWTQPQVQATFGVVIENPTDPNAIITGLTPDNIYNFTWTVNSLCGVVSDEILVVVSDPTPRAGTDIIVCDDTGSGVLLANAPTLGSSGAWSALNTDVTIQNPQSRSTAVSGLQPGANLFVWTIDEGLCGNRSRDTVAILYKVPPMPVDDDVDVEFGGMATFNALANDLLPPGSSASLFMQPARGSVVQNADGTFTFTSNINFVGITEMSYQVNSEGCAPVTGRARFFVGDNARCKVPSIITPNGDGINDTFVVPCLIDGIAYPRSQVQIFNRWGDEVFRSGRPYTGNWNGQYNGEDLPADTYFYIVDLGDGTPPTAGYVMIQR